MKDKNRAGRVGEREKPLDANRDPITGTPGAHPVGTGVGATGGGAAGAAIGTALGGPVGGAVGLAVGAIAGGLAGKGTAESVNPTVEDAYWRENYVSQPWVERTYTYEDYQPAFRTGYEGYSQHAVSGKSYAEAESALRADYERRKGKSRLDWEKARPASEAAWQRAHSTVTDRGE